MGQAVGESIVFAVGVAVSPIPIIAVVLILLSKRPGANSLTFAVGWILGIASVTAVVILASGAIDIGTDNSPSTGVSVVKLGLGVPVMLLGARYWRKRPVAGEPAPLPKWLQTIETITPANSGGFGVLLSVNPKSLLLIVAGGLAISGAPASPGVKVVAGTLFVAVAVSTVVVPVVLAYVLGSRVQPWLESTNSWLAANNITVMAVLLVVIGIALIGKGISGV
jgi:hypothetical protein